MCPSAFMGLFALAVAVAVLLFPHRILMIWTKIRLNQNECKLDFIGSTSNRKVFFHVYVEKLRTITTFPFFTLCAIAITSKKSSKRLEQKEKKWKRMVKSHFPQSYFKSPDFVKNFGGKEKHQQRIAHFCCCCCHTLTVCEYTNKRPVPMLF